MKQFAPVATIDVVQKQSEVRRTLRVSMLRVQLVDMVNGEPLTTPDKPAELDDSIAASELVQQILDFVGQLPEGHLVDPKATKIVNKSRRAELTSQQTLADVGTEDGDTLALYYSTVFGQQMP
jgi:hypothetical protein